MARDLDRCGDAVDAVREALNRRVAACPPARLSVGRQGEGSMAALSSAVHDALGASGRWLDKDAYDEALAAYGASDGTVRGTSWEWANHDVHPDDAGGMWFMPDGAVETFGAKWMRSRVPLAIVPPPGTPAKSPAIGEWARNMLALVGRMKWIVVPHAAGSHQMAWGGAEGCDAIRVTRDGQDDALVHGPHDANCWQYASAGEWMGAFYAGSQGGESWEPEDGTLVPRTPGGSSYISYAAGYVQDLSNGRYGSPYLATVTATESYDMIGAVRVWLPAAGAVLVHAAKTGVTWQTADHGAPSYAYDADSNKADYEHDGGHSFETAFDNMGTGYGRGWNLASEAPDGGGIVEIPWPHDAYPSMAPPAPWRCDRMERSTYHVGYGTTYHVALVREIGIRIDLILYEPDFGETKQEQDQ